MSFNFTKEIHLAEKKREKGSFFQDNGKRNSVAKNNYIN